MTLEEALDSGNWDNVIDVYQDQMLDAIYKEILNELKKDYDDKDWFIKYRLNPYFKKRFPYHIDWR